MHFSPKLPAPGPFPYTLKKKPWYSKPSLQGITKLELSQSAVYPTQRLVTEQVSFYKKKKNHGSA